MGKSTLYICEALKRSFCAFTALKKNKFQIALTSFCNVLVHLLFQAAYVMP